MLRCFSLLSLKPTWEKPARVLACLNWLINCSFYSVRETFFPVYLIGFNYFFLLLLVSKMTIEKITDYVTVKISKYSTYLSEVQEYKEAFAEGRKVYEPSKLEIVSQANCFISFLFYLFEFFSYYLEQEKRLEYYDPSLGVLTDYAQVFIQFGFVTLFVSACPVAPILGYFGNQIEIRNDGNKLLNDFR
jgi:hypothetical protein